MLNILSLLLAGGQRHTSYLNPFANIRHFGKDIRDLGDITVWCESIRFIISVDTRVVHLKCASDKNVSLFVPHLPDWRRMPQKADSPWYLSLRIFHLKANERWA
jgi:hypothetical protein